jgi:hypothetical protein
MTIEILTKLIITLLVIISEPSRLARPIRGTFPGNADGAWLSHSRGHAAYRMRHMPESDLRGHGFHRSLPPPCI